MIYPISIIIAAVVVLLGVSPPFAAAVDNDHHPHAHGLQQFHRQRAATRRKPQIAAIDTAAILTAAASSPVLGWRRIDETLATGGNGNVTSCGICRGLKGSTGVYLNAYPDYSKDIPPDILPPDLSCDDLNGIASTLPNDGPECINFKSYFSVLCCNVTDESAAFVPSYECESAVRSDLFGEDSTYDSSVAPIPRSTDGKRRPPASSYASSLNVSLTITYYHITSLSTMEGTAEIILSLDMVWRDERLRWDPNVYGGCFQTNARASLDVEKTELWVPDYDLLNRVSGVQSFADTPATLRADGTVIWFRLGTLKAICAFTGLERFPYDTLGCDYEFGSLLQLPVNYVTGFEFENVLDAQFQEFVLLDDRVEVIKNEEGFDEVYFYFSRASEYYTRRIVIPTIVFTLLSFGVFLLDVRVGERLAFGVSLLLVIVANAILTAGTLPVCKEWLWVNVLADGSIYWVFLALLESVAVAYLYFLDKEEEEQDAAAQAAEEAQRREENPSNDNYAAKREASMGAGNGSETEQLEGDLVDQVSTNVDDAASIVGSHQSDVEKHRSNIADPTMDSSTGTKRHSLTRFRAVTMRHLLIQSPPPSKTWRIRMIHTMDRVCLILCPVSYTVFFVWMFVANDSW